MKKCPFCGEVIEDAAIICRYCGRRVSGIKKARQISFNGLLAISLLVFLALAVTTLINQNAREARRRALITPAPSATRDLSTPLFAYQICRQFVSDQLKAPKTAEFQNFFDAQVFEYQPGHFEAIAFVDSENSFGALIREHFMCKVRYLGGDQWQLDELRFTD